MKRPGPSRLLWVESEMLTGVVFLVKRRPDMKGDDPAGPRTGFTLVELLVVLAILVILIGITLPAVMMTRARSQAVTCHNHLRQLGVAMAARHAAQGSFLEIDLPGPCRGQKQMTLFVHWMPYVEKGVLYETFPTCRLSDGRMHAFREMASPTPELLTCPADGREGGTNYRLCYGDSLMLANKAVSWSELPAYTGVFPVFGPVTASAITDGLSNTIGVSEKLLGADDESTFHSDRDVWHVGSDLNESVPLTIKVCRTPPTTPLLFDEKSGKEWWGFETRDVYYNHVVPPNAPGSDCTTTGWRTGIFRATSHHGGGVNTLRMDGSVHFAADGIDLTLWRALATRAGNETVAGE